MMFGNNLLMVMLIGALVVIPFWKLLPRYGLSKYYAVLAVMPAIALVLLWIIAFKEDVDGAGT